jgi:Ca2+-binding RTX toxin-like protein
VVQPFTLPQSGTPTHTFVGHFRDKSITGTGGNDSLDGSGGSYSMRGGGGDDTYKVDDAKDSVVEKSHDGIDTVLSSVSAYSLAANVENLTLVGSISHTGNGNGLNNLITASSGNDTINAGAGNDIIMAGIGADMLTGGAGKDMFVFSAPGSVSNVTDFHIGEDLLDLRPLFAAAHYSGSNPIADGVLALTQDGAGGVIFSADPNHSGSLHAVADLSGINPLDLRIGVDVLWHI